MNSICFNAPIFLAGQKKISVSSDLINKRKRTSIKIWLAIKIEIKSAEAIARKAIEAGVSSTIIKSKLLSRLEVLNQKYQLPLGELENLIDIDRIYISALEKEKKIYKKSINTKLFERYPSKKKSSLSSKLLGNKSELTESKNENIRVDINLNKREFEQQESIEFNLNTKQTDKQNANKKNTTLNFKLIELCHKKLASYIGEPISNLLIKDIINTNPEISLEKLIEKLSAEIPDSEFAKDFKKNVISHIETQTKTKPKVNTIWIE